MSEHVLRGGELSETPDSPDMLPKVPPAETAIDTQAITERIIEKVIGAAERNEPLEHAYEISHELKDKDAIAHQSFMPPMESIGAILQNKTIQPPQGESVNPSLQTLPMPTPSSRVSLQKPVLDYKRSVLYGVYAAITVAIFVAAAVVAQTQ